jgi:hypothetical protein
MEFLRAKQETSHGAIKGGVCYCDNSPSSRRVIAIKSEGTTAIIDLPSSILHIYLFFACANACSTIW